VAKFGRKVPHLRCDSRRPTSFKFKRSKVKVTRSRDQSETSCPNAVPVSLEAGGGRPCRLKPAATLLVLIVICICISYHNHQTVNGVFQLQRDWSICVCGGLQLAAGVFAIPRAVKSPVRTDNESVVPV